MDELNPHQESMHTETSGGCPGHRPPHREPFSPSNTTTGPPTATTTPRARWARGLEVVGFDVSQSMLGIARVAHPGIRFDEGLLSRLPVPDGSLAGAVCWYSIIHTPPDRVDEVVSEMARVLKPGGPLRIAFQVGRGEPVPSTALQGRPVSLTSYRDDPADFVCRLAAGGFEVEAR